MSDKQSASSNGTFQDVESAGGVFLMLSALLAIICANTSLNYYYDMLLSTPVAVQVGALVIAKPLLLWVNDGLMAVFFFLVGLELKRELLEGELADKRNIALPAIGAVGGMVFPALVYTFFNYDNDVAMKGWAIPAATDIAFALGVLGLLGSRVPVGLKVFLTSLAIFDDIGAIVIIAVFYTSKISLSALVVVAFCLPLLAVLNRRGVESKSAYIFIGVVMWVAMLKSGVHATLAGVVLAMFIPLKSKASPDNSPLKSLENDLHLVVAFAILPLFAFANAGINLTGVGLEEVMHDVPVGIALGLIVGKQVGIFGLCALAIKMGLAKFPAGMNWLNLYGTAVLCGIGFTMSLFISSLAFEETDVNLLFDDRLGIIVGSVVSGIAGYILIRFSLRSQDNEPNQSSAPA